jgi:hypothetical protein
VRAGHLHRLYRGVYAVVPPSLLKIEGLWLAAVLACGPDAALSHQCAAAHWEMRAVPSGPIHVTVPTRTGRRKRAGITVHRSCTLPPSQVVVRDSIPVTTPVETDGWDDHGTKSAFESDRERDAWLVARGFRVIRFTWRQLTTEGPRVAATLRRILDLPVRMRP